VDEYSEYRRPRWPRFAVTALGLAAAGAATMSVISAGGGATATDTPRTVVATVGPNTPHAAPQAVTDPGAHPEVAVRVDAGAPGAQPRVDLRQIVYTIAGNQRPNDPVTVVYADETGALRTVENVVPEPRAIAVTSPPPA